MKRLITGLLALVILAAAIPARADNLGCFNASQAVHIWAQFADANGEGISPTSPSAKVFSPTDTTTASFTPTLAEIDNSGSPGLARGTFTLGGSPVAGIWTVQYKGTVGGNELTLIDVFQVPCPSVAIRAGGIGPLAYQTAGTLTNISGTVLTLSADVIAATNHRAFQERVQVYDPTTGLHKASACVVASTTAGGPADTVTTAENISARIATNDAFDLVPDPSCRNLRATTAGNTATVSSGGEVVASSVQGPVTGSVASVTGNVGGNVAGSVASVTAPVTVGTNNDKAGYALTAGEHTAISGDVWGALRASYSAAGTFGQAAQVIRAGTAQAGASTTITLDASASAVNDFYVNATLQLLSGTGAGQTRQISSYVGSSKVATVNAAWATNPASDTVFLIVANGVNPAVSGITPADIWTYAGGRSLTDKAGFSLTQSFPANFGSMLISGGGAVTAGTVTDKSGYSLSQSFPTNFANLSIDANGRVDLSRWLGSAPNALISGRVDANAQAIGDKAGYSLTQSFPTNFNLLSIDASGRTDVSRVRGVTLDAQVGANFNTFWQNGGNATTKVVDDVGTGAGGGSSDWTATELNQIRYRLGIDGTTAVPSATVNLGSFNLSFAQALPGSPTADTVGQALKFAATRLEIPRPTGAIVAGAANCNGGANSAVTFATNLSYTATNHFDRTELITFETGALAGQSAQITGYTWTGAVGCVTVSSTLGLTATPGIGDSFIIVNK
jgi:hypothetical protein